MSRTEITFGVILLLLSSTLYSQEKVERFCEVTAYFGRPKHLQISIDIGNKDTPSFKDTTIINNLNKVTEFISVVDMLNYMTHLGWSILSINNLPHPNWQKFFYFKKTFDESDFVDSTAVNQH